MSDLAKQAADLRAEMVRRETHKQELEKEIKALEEKVSQLRREVTDERVAIRTTREAFAALGVQQRIETDESVAAKARTEAERHLADAKAEASKVLAAATAEAAKQQAEFAALKEAAAAELAKLKAANTPK